MNKTSNVPTPKTSGLPHPRALSQEEMDTLATILVHPPTTMAGHHTGRPTGMDALHSGQPTGIRALHTVLQTGMDVLHSGQPTGMRALHLSLPTRKDALLTGPPTGMDALHFGQPIRMDGLRIGQQIRMDDLHSVTPEVMENQETDLPHQREMATTVNRALPSGHLHPLPASDSGREIHETTAIGVTGLHSRDSAHTQAPQGLHNTVPELKNQPSPVLTRNPARPLAE